MEQDEVERFNAALERLRKPNGSGAVWRYIASVAVTVSIMLGAALIREWTRPAGLSRAEIQEIAKDAVQLSPYPIKMDRNEQSIMQLQQALADIRLRLSQLEERGGAGRAR